MSAPVPSSPPPPPPPRAPKLCPTCGTEYPADERFCPKDGSALRTQGDGAELLGSVIAERYHVVRQLGEGGMGRVYLAEHVKMGRLSAVKVMSRRIVTDADAISRFNREAANASRISHPNVAAVYDFGETSDGLIYLAMEFVDGEPLTEVLARERALPPERAAEIVRQTGEALSAAHDLGIVHRDLKPDNIMLARDRDGGDVVKVVDFGIAKAAGVEAQKVTRTGLVIGTPEYMSPEQIAGDPLDARSDVYSLGLVAYTLFTGQLPFPSRTAQESVIMRLTDPPKTLAELRGDVSWPPAVQEVMDRALQRDAAHRLRSAREFGRALRDAVAGAPVSLPPLPESAARDALRIPPTRITDAARPAAAPGGRPLRARMPMLAGAAALVVAVAVVGAVLASTRRSDADPVPEGPSPAARGPVTGAGAPVEAPDAVLTGAPAEAASRAAPASAARSERAAGETPAAPRSSAVTDAGLPARIRILLAQAWDDATARAARREAEALLPRARGAQVVGLELVRVRAYGLENDSATSCAILRDVRGRSTGTEYETEVTRLLQSC
ncbi:MAG TPA: serine/threonine-protein kinase [Gemmatimonadaceae bacterium]|nr:serine/threonine-protein kinase [Gemmatimonadaceae bacterium]